MRVYPLAENFTTIKKDWKGLYLTNIQRIRNRMEKNRFLGIFAVDLVLTLSIFDRSGYAAEASSCFDLAMGMDGSFPCSRSPTWTIPGLQQRSKQTPSAMKHWSVNPWWLWTCQILLWAAATQETQSNQLTGTAPRLEINKNLQIWQWHSTSAKLRPPRRVHQTAFSQLSAKPAASRVKSAPTPPVTWRQKRPVAH